MNYLTLSLLFGSSQAGKCPFGYDSKNSDSAGEQVFLQDMDEVHYPYEFFFDGAGDVQTHLMSTNRYEEIAKLVIKLIDDKDKDYTGEAVDE